MRAAVIDEQGGLEIAEVPTPEPVGGQALVRIEACGICGSDRLVVSGGFGEPGRIPGHEPAGVVEAYADGGEHEIAPGSPVAVKPSRACGACPNCARGMPELCPNTGHTAMGIGGAPGALAEYVVCEPDQLAPIPDGFDPAVAALAQPLAVGLHAISRSGIGPGEPAAVLGAGGVGMMVAFGLRARGVEDATVFQRPGPQAERAAELGLEVRPLDELSAAAPAVIFECTGAAEVFEDALAAAPQAATILNLGVIVEATLAPATWVWKELTLIGSYGYGPRFEEALSALVERSVPGDALAEHRVSLTEAPAAIERMGAPDAPFKTIVEPAP